MGKSQLSSYQQERLIEHFVSASTAQCAAKLIGVSKSTAAYYCQKLREILAYQCVRAGHYLDLRCMMQAAWIEVFRCVHCADYEPMAKSFLQH